MLDVNEISGKNPNKGHMVDLKKGRLPPQATEYEEAILGAMMIDKKGVDEVIDTLSSEAFYKESHRYIYQAILDLFRKPEAVDIMTVSAQLRKNGKLDAVGGDFYLIQLTKSVTSSAHIEFHARIVLQKHIMRSLINVCNEVTTSAYDETVDCLELLDMAESRLYDIVQGNVKQSIFSASKLIAEAKRKIDDMKDKKGVSGIPSGFTKLDKITSGWQPSDLIILAARPGMGKTAMSLTMARNMAIGSGTPVAFFSLEMSALQLITRLISSETGLESEKLRSGNLEPHEWEQLHMKVKDLETAPLFIDDTPSLSVFDLRAKARRLASQYGIKIIMVDYLQLMVANLNSKAGNREQEISTISRRLKALAKELNIPIIALSQLSRAVETRIASSKRPQLSDLRESGAIEQDADIVSFIYRPEYYKIDVWDDDEGSPTKDQAELIVAKHRNGGLGDIRLKFIGGLGKFENLDTFGLLQEEFHSKINSLPRGEEYKSSIDTSQFENKNSQLSGDEDIPF